MLNKYFWINEQIYEILTIFSIGAADDYNRIGSSLYALGTQDSTDICK